MAVAHEGLRELIADLLDRDHACWKLSALTDPAHLAASAATTPPDLVVVDAADFPRCCHDLLRAFPAERVVVIGPEPDLAYERAARRSGAGAWLARDRVAEDLGTSMRAALGCTHGPCPTPVD